MAQLDKVLARSFPLTGLLKAPPIVERGVFYLDICLCYTESMKKYQLTQQEYDKIRDQSESAQAFLESATFDFIREYLENATSSIEHSILNNTVKDVTERVTIGQTIKDFFTPKEVQVDELVGQYKFINRFIGDMQAYANQIKDLDQQIEKGRVKIRDEEAESE